LGGVALVAGSERCSTREKARPDVPGLSRRVDVTPPRRNREEPARTREGLELPPEALEDTAEHSVFMDIYASLGAPRNMKNFAPTSARFAAAAGQKTIIKLDPMNPSGPVQKDFSVE